MRESNIRLSIGESFILTETFDVFYDRDSVDFFRVIDGFKDSMNFPGGFFSDKGNGVTAKFETDGSNDSESGFWGKDQGKFINLVCDKFSYSPFLWVFLKIKEDINHIFSFFHTENLEEKGQILNSTILDFIIYELR